MKKIFCVLFFLLALQFSYAQLSFTGGFNSKDAKEWQIEDGQSSGLFENGFNAGIAYRLRIPNFRLEFWPELNYSQSRSELFNGKVQLDHHFASLFLNTRFYFLDPYGDCDCPTFHKEGPTIEKGLFLFVSPGISMLQSSSKENSVNTDPSFGFNIAGGLGMDFGLSELITITPYAGYRHYPNLDLKGINEHILASNPDVSETLSEKSNVGALFVNLSLTVQLRN